MNEHKDEVVSSVKESTVSVDSAKTDENVTQKEKIEAIFGEKDEAEDMMVDVVGSEVVVDNHGVTRVKVEKSLVKETQINDQVMEDVGVVEEVSDVLTVNKAEVVKEVVQENVVTAVVSGSGCEGEKSGNGPVVEDSRTTSEPLVEGDVVVFSDNKEVTESVEQVVDEKKGKEAEILSSVEVSETITTDDNHGSPVGQVEDKGEVGTDSQSLLTDAVNAGLGEENVHVSTTNDEQQPGVDQTKNEGLKSMTEVTTNDVQITDSKMDVESQSVQPEIAVKEEESERGLIEETVKQQTVESVKEVVVDHVTNEKDKKDEVLDSVKVPESVTKVDEVVKVECLAGKDEKTQDEVNVVNAGTDEVKHENAENLDKKVEVDETIEEKIAVTDSKKDNEPEIIEEPPVIDKEKKPEIGLTLTKETVEQQPIVSVQEAVDADQVFDKKPVTENEVLDSKKIPESSTVGTEEVDVMVVEVLEDKDEAKQVVNSEKCEILTTEVDGTSKTENLHEAIEVLTTEKSEIQPNSDVQVSTASENQSPKVADGSNPKSVEFTEPESSIDKIEPPIVGDTNNFQENQLNASNNETLEPEIRVPDYVQHDVEDDAGMDIDEVLAWKDEIPPMQNMDPTNLSNLDENVNIDLEEQEKDELLDLEHNLEAKKWKEASVSLHQSSYFHSPGNEGEFSVSDLVWGKVRSHPWWPGQIFDPSDASEKAMKYYKKDCFLVAYFGDRTFAWNESTVLKPFRSNFAQIANHTNLEAFDNAVHCALEEVSRRVELGLTCSCISRDIYENIKCQIVENSGIKPESSKRQGLDKSASVNSFEPNKLVDYVKLLAKFPYGEGDKMEITMAKAQLSAYGRFKGHRQLAEFQSCGDLLEIDADFEDGSRKRKANDSISDGSEKRVNLNNLNVESVQTAKPSFKVGACIQKVASQLTGVDQVVGNSNTVVSDQSEMLSQLHLTAQDPTKGFNFLNNIIPFFNNHRLAVLNKARQDLIEARKRKMSNENDPEEFEFDDVNDSYWTDRIIQNYPDEQENQNGLEKHHQIVAYENDKQQLQQQQQPVKQTRRSNKKRYFSSNHEIEAKEQTELIERRRLNLATEVLMKFTEGIYFPSEIHLNKMFKRFGPLLESETEVDRQNGRARVVFKKCCDAEVAHSSAGKFSIFGPIAVNYELNYTPLISYKPLPLQLGQDPMDAC